MTASDMLHATSVSHSGQALLITGGTGAGKSGLALELIALGAQLISDDRTEIRKTTGQLIAHPAPNISGLIEARGLGILRIPPAPPAPVKAVIDLDRTEPARLPAYRTLTLLGVELPLLHKSDTGSFAAALRLYLQHDLHTPQPPFRTAPP
jgi:HPr kinase/phosphorylase